MVYRIKVLILLSMILFLGHSVMASEACHDLLGFLKVKPEKVDIQKNELDIKFKFEIQNKKVGFIYPMTPDFIYFFKNESDFEGEDKLNKFTAGGFVIDFNKINDYKLSSKSAFQSVLSAVLIDDSITPCTKLSNEVKLDLKLASTLPFGSINKATIYVLKEGNVMIFNKKSEGNEKFTIYLIMPTAKASKIAFVFYRTEHIDAYQSILIGLLEVIKKNKKIKITDTHSNGK